MLPRMPSQSDRSLDLAKYSEKEWHYSNRQKCENADKWCSSARIIAEECNRICDELQDATVKDNKRVAKIYEEKIRDIKYWKNEVDNRLGRLEECVNRLLEFKDRIQNAITHYTPLLKAVSQCLLVRNEREGIDRVDDRTQQFLRKCLSHFIHLLDILEKLLADVIEQIRLDKAAKFKLKQNLNDMYSALNAEMSKANISFVTKPTSNLKQDAKSLTIDDWLNYCEYSIKKLEKEETHSQNLYATVDEILNECYREFEKGHKATIETMNDRIEEIRESKILLEERVEKVLNEIEKLEEAVLRLQEAIALKISSLSVSKMKLNERRYKPCKELSKDKIELELEKEIMHLEHSVQRFQRQLNEAKTAIKSLYHILATLEEDIRVKNHSISLDETRCLPIMNKIQVVPF